jgi:hypothetical protein
MADAKLVARANEVIDRLFALNEAMESADAFCAYLKELNARDVLVKQDLVKPSDLGAAHVLSIRWVHAGILRAAVGTITACLDPEDSRRGNRASVGQIIQLLKDKALVDLFAGAGQGQRWPCNRRESATKPYSKTACLTAQSGCGTTWLHTT